MEFLYRRHPEVRMGIELLIKPSASSFMGSDTQEIGPCTKSRRPVPFLMPVASAASVEQPSPSHLSLFSFWSRKSKNPQSNCQRHATQSHQDRMSKSSRSCTKKMSNETPYRSGHCFAGPSNSAAQAFSSCSKNLTT